MSEKYSSFPASTNYLEPIATPVVREQKYFLNVLLFLATIFTTLFWGSYNMMISSQASTEIPFGQFIRSLIEHPSLLHLGVSYSFTILSILLAHEMGHYLACVYYGIEATLPFFLPAPAITGTFGAFIRIRSPFPNRKSLFDVGLAGPIAGFVVALPFIYLGLKWSILIPKSDNLMYMGEPLIFKLLAPHLAEVPGKEYLLHPVGFAAWFACLATSLNLLPIAQLDGGHVSYALFGKKSYFITWIFFSVVVGLSIYGFTQSPVAGIQWLIYSILLLILKRLAGFRHPPTLDEDQPIGTARKIWGVIGLIVFILTFMPVTIFNK